MVQGLDEVAPARVGRLVEDLSTAQLADAYLNTKRRQCTGNTIRNYRWALGCLERVYPILPRVIEDIIRFVRSEPLRSSNSKRNLYNTIKAFYSWIKESKNPLIPELPAINFGRRRAGEKRGRRVGGCNRPGNVSLPATLKSD